MLDKSQSKYFKFFYLWGLVIILLIMLSVSYIQSEILTNIYRDQISNISELCPSKDTSIKYYKIVKYEKAKKELFLQCIYQDGRQNSEVVANLIKDIWTRVRVNKLNEKGGFYWPIYL